MFEDKSYFPPAVMKLQEILGSVGGERLLTVVQRLAVPQIVASLNDTLWGFGYHRVLTVACKTGILKYLGEHRAHPDEVARELKLDPFATGKIIRALCAMGIVKNDWEGSYLLASELAPLLKEGPYELSALFEHAHQLYEMWGEHLEGWLRGEKRPVHVYSEEGMKSFGDAMTAMTRHLAPQVLGALRPKRVKRGLDLGCGLGGFAVAFCHLKKDLSMTVVDLPEVVGFGQRALVGSNVEDRITFMPGSYFDVDVGSGYDVVILANVLHQELPEEAERLVRIGAKALAPEGQLAIIDFAIDEDRNSNKHGCIAAVNMFSFGDTYSESTIRGWMEAAGLKKVKRLDLFPVHWLILGQR